MIKMQKNLIKIQGLRVKTCSLYYPVFWLFLCLFSSLYSSFGHAELGDQFLHLDLDTVQRVDMENFLHKLERKGVADRLAVFEDRQYLKIGGKIKSNFDKEMQDRILNEMKSGDYINLLRTFEKYFGSVYTLQTSNPEYLDAFMVEKSA